MPFLWFAMAQLVSLSLATWRSVSVTSIILLVWVITPCGKKVLCKTQATTLLIPLFWVSNNALSQHATRAIDWENNCQVLVMVVTYHLKLKMQHWELCLCCACAFFLSFDFGSLSPWWSATVFNLKNFWYFDKTFFCSFWHRNIKETSLTYFFKLYCLFIDIQHILHTFQKTSWTAILELIIYLVVETSFTCERKHFPKTGKKQ